MNSGQREKNNKTAQKREKSIFSIVTEFFHRVFAEIFKKSFFGKYLYSYEKFENAVSDSGLVTKLHDSVQTDDKTPSLISDFENYEATEISGSYSKRRNNHPISDRVRKFNSNNKFINRFFLFLNSIPNWPVTSLGIFMLALGICSVIIQLIKFFVGYELYELVLTVVVGFLLLLFAIPIVTKSDITLKKYLSSGILFGGIIIPASSLSDDKNESVVTSDFIHLIPFVAGIVLSLLTISYQLTDVLWFLLVIVVFMIVVNVPEFGFTFALFILPVTAFLTNSEEIAGIVVLFVFVTYIFKVAAGKRIMRLRAFDAVLVIFFGYIIISELIYGSLPVVNTCVFCIMVYLLTANMLRVSRWIEFVTASIIASSTIVSAIGVFQFIISLPFGDTRVTSVFDSPASLGVFLLASIFYTVCEFSLERFKKSVLAISLILQIVCICMTGVKAVIISLVIGMLLYVVLVGIRIFAVIFATLCALPIVAVFLPSSVSDNILSVLSFSHPDVYAKICTWKNTIRMIVDIFPGSVGLGSKNFSDMYSAYAVGTTVPTASDPSSIYLQLLSGGGIVALLLLLAIILLFLRMSFTFYSRHSADHKTKIHIGAFCSVMSMLVCGSVMGIWNHFVGCAMFCVSLGIAVALRRQAEIEDESVEKNSFHSSEISVD